MDPITLGVIAGVTGISLVAQWYASEKAQKLDEARRNEIGAAIAAFERNYKMPELDPTPVTLEQYKLLKDFAPKIASYVQEKMPNIITEADSQDVVQVQKDAMNAMLKMGGAGSGEDPQSRALKAQAEADAQAARKRLQQDMLRNYMKQGLAGGNQELLAQVANMQQTENAMRLANLDAAGNVDGKRLEALKGAANQANSLRGDNYKTESNNVNTINSFNQRNAMNQNEYNKYVANEQNDAEKYNINQHQRNANDNTDVRNMNRVNALARKDLIEGKMREAANDLNTNRLQGRMGQAVTLRQDGQAQIGRDLGMANTAITGIAGMAETYAKGGKAPTSQQPPPNNYVMQNQPPYSYSAAPTSTPKYAPPPTPNYVENGVQPYASADELAKRLKSGNWFDLP